MRRNYSYHRGMFILCNPGDRSMLFRKRPKLSRGCRILSGVWFPVWVCSLVSYTVDLDFVVGSAYWGSPQTKLGVTFSWRKQCSHSM